MKTLKFPLFILLCFLVFISCADNEKFAARQDSPADGNWILDLTEYRALIGLSKNLIIHANLKSDDTHVLYATEDSAEIIDTVFWHAGNWTQNDTAVFLQGSDCRTINRNTTELEPFDCSNPIPIHVSIIDEKTWNIRLSDLRTIAEKAGILIPESAYSLEFIFQKEALKTD